MQSAVHAESVHFSNVPKHGTWLFLCTSNQRSERNRSPHHAHRSVARRRPQSAPETRLPPSAWYAAARWETCQSTRSKIDHNIRHRARGVHRRG
uniref:Uncharacterized protein n=1 Tax=Anopheles dirus TaxID=7168 RepID=A0A182NWW8_9DIPT